jgi:hypothetical protein
MTTKLINIKSGEPYDIYIGRPSKFGNSWTHLQYNSTAPHVVDTREEAVKLYEEWIRSQPELMAAAKKELKDRTLGCWCAPLLCHGDVLIKIVNEE